MSFERKTAPRRLWIDPDVVFRRGRDIALATGRAAHHHAAADPLGKLGIALERERDIGERPERHEVKAGLGLREAQDDVYGRLALGLALRGGVFVVAQAILPMEPMRVLVRAIQRLVGAGEDGDVGFAELRGEQRVSRRLLHVDIAGDRRQAEDVHARLSERHDDRDGVVGGGVGVDEEVTHGASDVSVAYAAALSRAKPRSRSSFRSSMSSRPALKRTIGPPGAKRVAVRVAVQSTGTARLS